MIKTEIHFYIWLGGRPDIHQSIPKETIHNFDRHTHTPHIDLGDGDDPFQKGTVSQVHSVTALNCS